MLVNFQVDLDGLDSGSQHPQLQPITDQRQLQPITQQLQPITQHQQLRPSTQQLQPITDQRQMQQNSQLQHLHPITQRQQLRPIIQQLQPITDQRQQETIAQRQPKEPISDKDESKNTGTKLFHLNSLMILMAKDLYYSSIYLYHSLMLSLDSLVFPLVKLLI